MSKDNEYTAEMMEQSIELLRENNVRITPQRRLILKYMIEARHHPTVERIYEDVSEELPGMSLATVYNNLKTLIDVGLVKEMKFSDVTSRFDFIYKHDHYHILCQDCGVVGDFNVEAEQLEAISQAASDQLGYKVNRVGLELYGLCPDCQAKRQSYEESDDQTTA